jgi:hypothetical protein
MKQTTNEAGIAQNPMLSDAYKGGNEKIATFMGYKNYNNTGAWVNEKGNHLFVLSYQDSFSEMMKVVDKIERLSDEEDFEVNINKTVVAVYGKSIPKLTHISPTATSIFRVVGDEIGVEKHTCLWEVIVEFLDWWNGIR